VYILLSHHALLCTVIASFTQRSAVIAIDYLPHPTSCSTRTNISLEVLDDVSASCTGRSSIYRKLTEGTECSFLAECLLRHRHFVRNCVRRSRSKYVCNATLLPRALLEGRARLPYGRDPSSH